MIAFVRPIYFFFFFVRFCALIIFSNGQGKNEFSHFLEEEELGSLDESSAQVNSKAISKSIEGKRNNANISSIRNSNSN